MNTLKNQTDKLFAELEDKLHQIDIEQDNVLKKAEESILIARESLKRLKLLAASHKFKNYNEEIFFFKNIKPLFFSKLIFFTKVFSLEYKRPNGRHKAQIKYLQNELDDLRTFFNKNLEFYMYYRAGSTYLDEKYFVRGNHDIHLSIDNFYFITDEIFSTSHDFKVSKILANEKLKKYLDTALSELEQGKNQNKTSLSPKVKLTWTASKTDLTELIYGLHTSGCFNHKKADVKLIASYFESVFNINLGDYYRTYIELRVRKTGRTRFFDLMKQNILRKMDEDDL